MAICFHITKAIGPAYTKLVNTILKATNGIESAMALITGVSATIKDIVIIAKFRLGTIFVFVLFFLAKRSFHFLSFNTSLSTVKKEVNSSKIERLGRSF